MVDGGRGLLGPPHLLLDFFDLLADTHSGILFGSSVCRWCICRFVGGSVEYQSGDDGGGGGGGGDVEAREGRGVEKRGVDQPGSQTKQTARLMYKFRALQVRGSVETPQSPSFK